MNGAAGISQNKSYSPPQPANPDSLSGVVSQTNCTLQDIESRLTQILERLQPMVTDKRLGGEVPAVASGSLNMANIGRNTAQRIHDLCNVLDNLI